MDQKLAASLLAAQRAIKSVAHDKHNAFHGYGYVSAEAIIAESRSALHSANLAPVMLGWQLDAEDVHVDFALYHESGASAEFKVQTPAVVERGRPRDKAVSAALTLAESYWLRGLLAIPRVAEADDVAARDDTKYEPPPPAPKLATAAELKELAKAAKDHGLATDKLVEYVRNLYTVDSPRQLTSDQIRSVVAWVRLSPAEAA